MGFTTTADRQTFAVPPPTAVTLNFLSDRPGLTQAVMPSGSTFSTGRHWHDDHVEHIIVKRGAVLLTIGNQSKVVTSEDPVNNDGAMVEIPCKKRHEVMRWDRLGLKGHQKDVQDAFKGSARAEELDRLSAEDMVLEEWTSPNDRMKELFLRQLLSAIMEPRQGFYTAIKPLHILNIMAHLDSRQVLVDLGAEGSEGWKGKIEEVISSFVLRTASALGLPCGLWPVTPEYTPEDLQRAYGDIQKIKEH